MGSKSVVHRVTVEAAIREINALDPVPDFVVDLGDSVHDGAVEEFQCFVEVMAQLKPKVFYVAGEHDWYSEAEGYYQSQFIRRPTPYYSSDCNGSHLVVLHGVDLSDAWSALGLSTREKLNISSSGDRLEHPPFMLGKAQLEWLEQDLLAVDPATPLLVFSHTPLFHHSRTWNRWVQDAPALHTLLRPFSKAHIFHGHVHQCLQQREDSTKYAAALTTVWPDGGTSAVGIYDDERRSLTPRPWANVVLGDVS